VNVRVTVTKIGIVPVISSASNVKQLKRYQDVLEEKKTAALPIIVSDPMLPL